MTDEIRSLIDAFKRIVEVIRDACVVLYNRMVALSHSLKAAGGWCQPLEPVYMWQEQAWTVWEPMSWHRFSV